MLKKILLAALWLPLMALAQTYPSPTYQNLTVLGTTHEGAVAITGGSITGTPISGSTGSFTGLTTTGSFTATGLVTTADLATQAANTVLANVTGSSASPTAFAMPSCSGTTNALGYTSGTGIVCNSAINAATLGGTTFAAPGPIGSTTPGTGAFTTLSATSAPTLGAATFYPTVATNAALQALSTATTSTVTRLGFYAAGDTAPLIYTASGSACSLNAGNGDNGSQVKSANSLCWIANFPSGPRGVKEWGAYGDGSHDDTTAVQAAVTSLPTSGGTINFPQGTYKLSSTIQVGNGTSSAASTTTGIVLAGDGRPSLTSFGQTGWATLPTVKFTWAGGASPMIKINGPLAGWGLENLYLDGGSTSTYGIQLYSASGGYSKNLTVTNFTTSQIASLTYAQFAGATLTDSIANQWNNITTQNPAVSGVMGILIDGAANSDTDYNTFTQTTVVTSNSVTNYGVYLRAADSVGFDNLHVFGAASGGIVFDYSFRQFWPAGCWFNAVDNTSGWSNVGTPGPTGGALAPNLLISVLGANNATYPVGLANLQIIGVPSQWASKLFTGQTTALATSAITPYPVTHSGLYRVTGYLFITAAGTGGTITPTISWNDGNNGPSVSGSAVNTTGGWTQFSSVIYAAATTNISFSTTFSGVTGTPAYTAAFNVEQLQ